VQDGSVRCIEHHDIAGCYLGIRRTSFAASTPFLPCAVSVSGLPFAPPAKSVTRNAPCAPLKACDQVTSYIRVLLQCISAPTGKDRLSAIGSPWIMLFS